MGQVNKENSNLASDEISVKDLILKIQIWWKYLLLKWKTVFLCAMIGGVLGLTYACLKKPVYTAELSFALDEEK